KASFEATTATTMKILIVGSTGKTGIALIKASLAAGHTLTAFACQPEALFEFKGTKIEKGDVLNREDVERAVVGQELVLSALGAPLGSMDLLAEKIWRVLRNGWHKLNVCWRILPV
ncbi:MAG: NAD(P)H-binding protein, partial [Chloroflexota bacterium]